MYEKGYTCVFCFTLIIHYKIVEERNQSERIRYEDTLFSTFHCLRFLSWHLRRAIKQNEQLIDWLNLDMSTYCFVIELFIFKNYRFHCLSLIISFTPTVYCTASYRTEWFERKLVLYLFFWKTIKPGYNLTIVPYISRYLKVKLTYNVNSLNPSSEDRKWLPTKWTTLNSFSIKSLYM